MSIAEFETLKNFTIWIKELLFNIKIVQTI